MDYSKGDWRVRTQKCARYWKAEVRLPDKKDDGRVVEFGQLIAAFYGKNTIGNAHLTSAAPNMLEALQPILNILTYHFYNNEAALRQLLGDEDFQRLSAAYSDGCKALNKVEGKLADIPERIATS